MEFEASKGEVTEVGLEKYPGSDIKRPHQSWAGHWEVGGQGVTEWESPLTLILNCFCALQIGIARGMLETPPGPTVSLYRCGSKEQTGEVTFQVS